MFASILLAAPLVVLDPGHGGAAAGVESEGLKESEVTLEVALVAAEVLRAGGLEVRLTRQTDKDVDLGSRIRRAAGASAFVSLHVNSAPGTQRRGTESYVAAIEGVEAIAVAPIEGKPASPAPPAPGVPGILGDLRRRGARWRAAELARLVQERLAAVPGMGPDRGVRQAPFAVVQNAKVPSVLVEMGFMTHPEQRRLLAQSQVRRALGTALAQGIVAFLED
ncbi:MAG: N-acetylmuramoyl-L-alanine amidase [Myxococcota bacterium]